MRGKLNNQQGLTLVEMLCAVIILILLGLILNTGLQLSVKAYDDMTAETETELLLSTAADSLADVLRFAERAETKLDGTVKFVHPSFGAGTDGSGIEVSVDGDGKLLVGGKQLLPPGAYRNGIYVIADDMELTYSETTGCFTVKLRAKEKDGEIFAEQTFTVKCLNPAGVPAEEAGG